MLKKTLGGLYAPVKGFRRMAASGDALTTFRPFVPAPLRLWIYLLFALIFQFSTGMYPALAAHIAGSEPLMQDDVMMCSYCSFIGLTMAFPLLFPLKWRLTNKTILLVTSLSLVGCNVIMFYCRFVPLIAVVCFADGLLRMWGMFGCMSSLMPILTPARNFYKFFSVIYFIVLGCVQLSGIVNTYIAYYLEWRYMYLLVMALQLALAASVLLLMRHEPPRPLKLLLGIDWIGLVLWALLLMVVSFIFVYGEYLEWYSSPIIGVATGAALLVAAALTGRMSHLRHPYIEARIFTYRNVVKIMVIFLIMCMMMCSQTTLQNLYTAGVLHFDALNTISLNWLVLLGVGAGAYFSTVAATQWGMSVKMLTFVGMLSVSLYTIEMYFIISPETTLSSLYLPSFLRGFGNAVIYVALTAYVQKIIPFPAFMQGISVLGFMRTGIASPVGGALYEHLYKMQMNENLALLGSDINFSSLTHLSLDTITGQVWLQAQMVSLKNLFGLTSLLGIITLLIIMIYRFNVGRYAQLPAFVKKRFLALFLLGLVWLPAKLGAAPHSLNPDTLSTSAPRVVSLEQLFAMADSGSKTIKSCMAAAEAADETLKAARRDRLPNIDASLSASYLGNGLIWNRDFSHRKSVDIPHFGNNFSLAVTQLLYAGGSLSSSIEQARLGSRMAALNVQKERQDVRFLLTGYYLDLYKTTNQIEVYDRNIDLTQKLIDEIAAKQRQGTAITNDLNRYTLQLKNLQLDREVLCNNVSILNRRIVTTLGLDPSCVIAPDTLLLEREVDLMGAQEWQEAALSGSLALQQAAVEVALQRNGEKSVRSSLLPRVSLMAQEHLDGPVTIEVPALNNNFNYWFVGIGIQYNLSSLYKGNKKLKAARLETQRSSWQQAAARDRVGNEVQEAYVTLGESFSQVKTHGQNLELARLNYRVTSNRYRNDLALLTDMLDASHTRLVAELDLVNAKIDLLYNYLKLKYVCGQL